MKCNVLVRKEIDIKPGDVAHVIRKNWKGEVVHIRNIVVKRIIETASGIRVVFIDSTWRPLSTYGITWEKVS